jgi:hypothetical protein
VMLAGGLDAALGFVERNPTQGRRPNR